MVHTGIAAFLVLAAVGALAALRAVLERRRRWAAIDGSELMREVCRAIGESGDRSPAQVAETAAAYRNAFLAAQALAWLGVGVSGAQFVGALLDGHMTDALVTAGFAVVTAILVGVFIQITATFGAAARRLRAMPEGEGG